jgi:hypothetical protein
MSKLNEFLNELDTLSRNMVFGLKLTKMPMELV